MKTISSYLCFIAMFAMLFTSCSKEETTVQDDNSEKAVLSFGAIVNDLADKSAAKQTSTDDLPQCTDDAPAYVEIVLSQGGTAVVGSNDAPYRVDLVAGQVFTEEDPELELDPGNYSLDHFMVYNEAGELIWVAPKGGVLAEFIDNPLPLNISLGAGVKKYVDVSVLCYDDRDVREYGYLFFDMDKNEAIEFCIFGNYCPPSEGGRHYPARFSVDVWMWADGQKGTQIQNDVTNTVEVNSDGDYAGSTACLALPDKPGQDDYYVEITLLNSDAYPALEERVIRRGVVSDGEVKAFFDGETNLDYFHFREGDDCGEDDTPIFEDPADEAVNYKACLNAKNGTLAGGWAYFRVKGDVVETTVLATNLAVNKQHPQHVHEGADCSASGSPILTLDNEDGSWPTANSYGDIIYHRTFTGVTGLESLADRTVNLHGKMVGEEYQMGTVVACGEIELYNFGE
ncbi:hypothetical protein [Salinimicrobium flavum]|uniref:CHRD domain-containing protein n=1 Tax=Salinimicrobium flavum TaxID=1737065 RepID=A0ABW5J1N2_9FLAO